jgi:hypothetical protein
MSAYDTKYPACGCPHPEHHTRENVVGWDIPDGHDGDLTGYRVGYFFENGRYVGPDQDGVGLAFRCPVAPEDEDDGDEVDSYHGDNDPFPPIREVGA